MKRIDFVKTATVLCSSLFVIPKAIASGVTAIKGNLLPKIVRSNEGGYNGSFCATHSGFSVPVLPVQTVPYY